MAILQSIKLMYDGLEDLLKRHPEVAITAARAMGRKESLKTHTRGSSFLLDCLPTNTRAVPVGAQGVQKHLHPEAAIAEAKHPVCMERARFVFAPSAERNPKHSHPSRAHPEWPPPRELGPLLHLLIP